MRKLRPNQSVGEIYLTKNESDHLDKYLLMNHDKSSNRSNDLNKQLSSNKRSLKKLGYGIKGKFSFSNLRKI